MLITMTAGLHVSHASGQEHAITRRAGKAYVSLNTGESVQWTLQYGPQDNNAPMSPGELKKSGRPVIDATVPGNVELDLLGAGKIKDPMKGNNVYALREYETYQWWYRCTFNKPEVPEGDHAALCFDGIDCIADIWLNDQLIGHAENMLVEYRFDVTNMLREENELYVCIFSPVLEARKYTRESLGPRADALPEGVNIRKAPHMYGWDILPRVVSASIWKDVRLEIIPPTHWKSVYWFTSHADAGENTAEVLVDWEFDTDRLFIDDLHRQVVIRRNGKIILQASYPVYTTCGRDHYNLSGVDLWWPRGYGEPALYDASMQLTGSDGSVICEDRRRIGIRKAELVRSEINTPESPGEFVFKINGEKIFVHGTNWVALDALHSRDRIHLDTAMAMLVDLNCNMVRCWGGNVYESDAFFDLCDRNGIMVWQDFAMGCTIYPQNREFQDKIIEEATKVILRLRNHPSLVLWAGNNENDVSLSWGGEQSHIDPNTDVISRQVLPSLVRQYDPERPYLPSSPYISSAAFALHGRIDETVVPEVHLWGPRGYYKAPFYTANHAKFVSEIGYHGCPSRESLEKMMDKDFVYPWVKDFEWNDQWQTKAVRTHPYATVTSRRNDLMVNQIKCIFGEVPTNLDTFILASQVVQAEAVKYFIEFWRMARFDRKGILWWNLRDGWPILSDAVVDYYNNRKLAYYYIRKVQADVCVMIGDARNGQHPVVAVNDTREVVSGTMTVTDAETKKVLISKPFTVAKNGKSDIGNLPETSGTKLWLIGWEVNGKKYTNHYLAFQPPIALGKYLEWLSMIAENYTR